ncbi:Alpha/beta superfamily hydrolase [Moritella viscosa]|uniref:alpha/beta fold hydrolase n=1 Tax=Moritella viscosa TaxID=80854 RepID=UPI000916B25F|nr:alpha/beta fold hydrolase [Moritella viscosa]SGY88403.1 Alpha/beta superfamily hydrolase [Moritella viscosa]
MSTNSKLQMSNNQIKNNNNENTTTVPCYYEQQGSGSPIVFIHGSYATTSTWKKIVQQLANTHHCISIKLPGHSGMPDPDDFSAPNINTELHIIESVVTKLTNQPIHLIGHSFGGVVALALALKGSIEIQELTLFEPVSTWVLESVEDRGMMARVNEFVQDYRQGISNNEPYVCGKVIDFWAGKGAFNLLPDFIKDAMVPLTANNNRHWTLSMNIHLNRKTLNALTIPTRLVCGSVSNPVAQAIVNHLSNELANSKKYMIQGASHFLVTSHATQCLDIISKTIQR